MSWFGMWDGFDDEYQNAPELFAPKPQTNMTLLPCPLCGEPGQEKKTFDRFARGWVGCPKCKLYINWQHSDKEAKEKWNKRA